MANSKDGQRPASSFKINPLDIPAFLPYACSQLTASFNVKINIRVQEEYVSKEESVNKKAKKPMESTPLLSRAVSTEDTESPPSPAYVGTAKFDCDAKTIVLTLVYDTMGRLVELNISRFAELPRLLIQILALCLPYHVHLNKLSINWIKLDGATLYEIGKLVSLSHLTELCLDDAPVPQRNYSVILESMHLKRLSLNRCDIDDEDCTAIANYLVHPSSASKKLLILSLVSNWITDVGAIALGNALRSNRCLKYLNISGNYINDDGAIAILKHLMTFSLSCNELMMKWKRLFDYLKLRKSVYARCYQEQRLAAELKLLEECSQGSRKKMTRTTRLASKVSMPIDPITMRADTMTNELVGMYSDPFHKDEVVARNGLVYCLGNMTLCSLNLSCNNIGYLTIVKLVEVLLYQSRQVNRGPGLIRVAIEINETPEACAELETIQQMIEQILCSIKSIKTTKRTKSKTNK